MGETAGFQCGPKLYSFAAAASKPLVHDAFYRCHRRRRSAGLGIAADVRQNHRFPVPDRRMPRKIAARKSRIHGNGVFAVLPLKKGERVIEYKGRRRTHAEVDRDEAGDVETGHTFLFTLSDDYVIDANYEGNDARWINHSCAPNCEAVIIEAEGDDRRQDKVVIETLRAIKPGADLQLRHHPGRAAHAAAEEDLGMPLRLEELHRHHAAAQALSAPARGLDARLTTLQPRRS
jgi:uncharacterized protein